MRIHPIRTKRLLLRKPEMRDAAVLVGLLSEPSVAQNIPRIKYPFRRRDAVAWLTRVRKPRSDPSFGRGYEFLIEMDGRVVGSCHLSWNLKEKRAFFGYWVGKEFRGQGIASEASKALIDFSFGRLGAQRVWALAFADNAASRHVLQKAGLKEEAMLRHVFLFHARWRDDACYGMLRREWRASHARSTRDYARGTRFPPRP